MSGGRRGAVLPLLCTASFMAVVDTTIVSIALPAVREDLGFTVAGAQWVFNAYALVFGGLLLLLGRLGDLVGRRRLFEVGLVVFAAGSVVAGVARQPWVLVAGRLLQGAGAGAFVPASLSLLTSTFRDKRGRGRALGVYGSTAGLGFVVGMTGGGVITQAWGWRWVFLVNVPVAVIALLPSRRVLAESRSGNDRRLDVAGAATVTVGVALLIYATTSVPRYGWFAAPVLVASVAGAACLVAFVLIERWHPVPLLPRGVVTRRPVLVPNAALALQSMVGIAWLYVLTLYFQEIRGLDALHTGMLFVPMTLAAVVAAGLAGRLSTIFGLRRTAAMGLGLVAAGLVVMSGGVTGAPWVVVAGMVVGEAGFMLANVPLTIAATSSLQDHHAGLAAGLANTAMQLGGALGLGVVAAVASTAAGGLDAPPDGAALRWALLTCLGGFCLPALVLIASGLPATRTPSRPQSGRPSPTNSGCGAAVAATSRRCCRTRSV
jgi:EmrB/QacA subfamily drug resistance transporter